MKFCGCSMCRRGMHGGRFGHYIVKGIIRKFRRQTKQDLKQGYHPDKVISVPYTD